MCSRAAGPSLLSLHKREGRAFSKRYRNKCNSVNRQNDVQAGAGIANIGHRRPLSICDGCELLSDARARWVQSGPLAACARLKLLTFSRFTAPSPAPPFLFKYKFELV
ncbi:hypothetical protein EVAR_25687_1 [Eumeta japonica]|uniref:Uncharacterized protein n=1 Tax=Eumeta variegata TaxID=151549 RepID=A0A4C1WEI3_EUMVA|nr:hypothetical protein EVAR_25687_1 [Eumeta japonica]